MTTFYRVCHVVAICTACVRIGGVTNVFFKDFAHVLVGMFLGLWIGDAARRVSWAVLFWCLCIIEVMCFIASRIPTES